ncbi:MAG: excinuclease ABC subunit UvrC, partial [Lachnospiraceae bacterium]|nr:excinuclease ABC subunit UvrC [Lachnospiraceae bacterium]
TAVRETLELMQQIFHLRTCHRRLPEDIGKERPCLNYYIHRCMGPCTGKITQEEYMKAAGNAMAFLEGKQKEVVQSLQQEMNEAAEALDFERAAVLRDQIRNIRALENRQIIENADSEEERDVIAYALQEGTALVQVFFIRSGKLIGREHFFLEAGEEEPGGEIIRAFIGQFYSGTPYIPGELLVTDAPEDLLALEEWLGQKAGHRVYIRVPKRGEKHDLLELARKNAELTLSQFGTRMKQEEKRTQGAMNELSELLGIMDEEMPPSRVEAYDISNTYGFLSVGSMVVFENGRPLKNDYRKFRIKTVYGANDYASLQEVLRRRFAHAFEEIKERQAKGEDISVGKFTRLPDLILMDGGKGQVSIAEEVLAEFGLEIPIAGMVKDDHHRTRGLYYQGQEVDLDGHREVFHLVTRIQDEAHRFAITYHRRIRSEAEVQSVLEEIPGIGPSRRKALVTAFGSVDAIRTKSENELASVPGMTAKSAAAVYEFFHRPGDEETPE